MSRGDLEERSQLLIGYGCAKQQSIIFEGLNVSVFR